MSPTARERSLRSVAYWPADRPLDAAAISAGGPDAIILDLEDGVPRERLAEARARLVESHATLRGLVGTVAVRVNGADSDAFRDDLAQLRDLPDDAVVIVPKPVTPAALAALAGGRRTLWCMAEQLDLADRLAGLAAAHPALSAVVVGIKDLSLELGAPLDPDHPQIRAAAGRLREAAQAAGLLALDGIVFGDGATVARRCERSAAEGFDGVTLARVADAPAARAAFEVGAAS